MWLMSPSLINAARNSTGQTWAEHDIWDVLMESYPSKMLPRRNTTHGTLCKVNLLIRGISKVDDMKMEYTIQLTLRQEWNDDRLAFDDRGVHEYLTAPDPEKIWTPDLFFQNEREGHAHSLMAPNVLLRLYRNGDIMKSSRITLTLACPMDFHFFPMDRQVCEIRLASYGFTKDDLDLQWSTLGSSVQVAAGLNLPRFILNEVKTDTCTSTTSTGVYACLKVSLFLERRWAYFLVHTYIPSIMMLFISWISFWISPESTAPRIVLCMAPLFGLASIGTHVNDQVPQVSYTKASDVWFGFCNILLFSALVVAAIVNYRKRMDKLKETQQKDRMEYGRDFNLEAQHRLMGPSKSAPSGEEEEAVSKPKPKGRPCCFGRLCLPFDRVEKIDYLARFLFPVIFLIFNIIYWPCYLSKYD
ncbi:Glutamate-gated chloride channel [Hypsibius exemplaris]|uniref:Glutamate-gated chloride channel n=1 Tax=Hypsibius exemplaris TaxID=2072580 RepID=A0A1W0WKP6_HYPEX|nr:Glutamate-gated chloride channel [Hypsibius exemplaris]